MHRVRASFVMSLACALCVLAVAAVVPLPLAVAQEAPAVEAISDSDVDRMVDGQLPIVQRRSIERLGRVLWLNEDQLQTVETLYDGYRAEIRQLMRPMMERQRAYEVIWERHSEAVNAGEPGAWEKYQKEVEELEKTSGDSSDENQNIDRLKKAFDSADRLAEDIGLVLDGSSLQSPERLGRWYRRSMLSRPELPFTWSGADLVEAIVSAGVDLPKEGELVDAVLRYEKEVDATAQAAWTLMQRFRSGELDKIDDDGAKQMEVMAEGMRLMREAQKTNRHHARVLRDLVPADLKQAVEAEFLLRAAPWIYRNSSTARAFERALGLSDLTEEQRDRVASAHAAYQRDLASLNDRWRLAVEEKEKNLNLDQVFSWWEENEEDPVAKAKAARRELDEQFRQRLESVLKADQIEHLPIAFPDYEYDQYMTQEHLDKMEKDHREQMAKNKETAKGGTP